MGVSVGVNVGVGVGVGVIVGVDVDADVDVAVDVAVAVNVAIVVAIVVSVAVAVAVAVDVSNQLRLSYQTVLRRRALHTLRSIFLPSDLFTSTLNVPIGLHLFVVSHRTYVRMLDSILCPAHRIIPNRISSFFFFVVDQRFDTRH